jgi:polar amino acid transport system substrate-binding protein
MRIFWTVAMGAWFVLMTAIGVPGFAQGLQILTSDLPPAAFLQDGKPTGFCVALAEEIERRIGDAPATITFVPWPRAYYTGLHSANTLLLCPKRTADRENQFKWVGPVNFSQLGFYVKTGSPFHFKDMDDIDRAQQIVVPRDFFFSPTLRQRGFKTIEEADRRASLVDRSGSQHRSGRDESRADRQRANKARPPSL